MNHFQKCYFFGSFLAVIGLLFWGVFGKSLSRAVRSIFLRMISPGFSPEAVAIALAVASGFRENYRQMCLISKKDLTANAHVFVFQGSFGKGVTVKLRLQWRHQIITVGGENAELISEVIGLLTMSGEGLDIRRAD